MADVTVEASLEAGHYLASKRSGIIWISDTVGYDFFITAAAAIAGPLKYSKTSDGGQTWAADVTIESGNAARFSVYYDKETNGDTGGLIHVLWGSWDDNHAYYRSVNTASSDTLSTTEDLGSVAGVGDINASYDVGYCSLTKARGGNLYAFYHSDAGGNTDTFFRSTDGGATWGTRTGPGEGVASDRVWLIPAGDTDSNDIACIFYDQSASQLSFKLHDDSANTWGSETTIASSVVYANLYWGFDVSIRHSDNKAIIAWWTDENTATADLNVSVLTLTAAGANATALTAIATNLSAAGEVCVMINGNNDDIYVAWISGGTWDSLTDIDHTVSTDDGSTWAGTTQFSETQDDLRNVHCMSIIASGQSGRWMPVWENDDLNDLVTNKVNSVSISAGGGGVTTRRYSLSLTGVG